MNRGTIYALSAYLIWGLLPIYWKALGDLPALETTAHRIVWSAIFAAGLLALRRHWRWLPAIARRPRVWLTFSATALLILVNYLIYIAAINQDQIVETSLGYFINPLVNVVLAVLFLRERPRPWQWVAIALATAGVVYLTVNYGRLPWIALGLAFSFGFYGLLKRVAPLGAVEGFFLEMILLALPMAIYLGYLEQSGAGTFGHAAWTTTLLLILTGVVTGTPLMLFSAGALRVPLTVLGILQYLAPTIQFLLGVLLYHEPFSETQLAGFSLIWLALVLFTVEGLMDRRRPALSARQPSPVR